MNIWEQDKPTKVCGFEWTDENGDHSCEFKPKHKEPYHVGQGFISVPSVIASEFPETDREVTP